MRADGVVDSFPGAEFAIEFSHFQGAGVTGSNSSVWVRLARSTAPLSWGERGGSTKSCKPRLLASLFELGGELRAAVDLHGADGKRHAVRQRIEELCGGQGGGAGVGWDHIPARDHVPSGELFEDHARHRTHL